MIYIILKKIWILKKNWLQIKYYKMKQLIKLNYNYLFFNWTIKIENE